MDARGEVVMTAKEKLKPSMLHCVSCGVTQEAACDCGVGYMPAAKYMAAKMLANAERYSSMSDRAIAAEIGVSDKTVAAARASTAENSAVAKRVGLDGKARKQPQPKLRLVEPEEMPTQEEADEEWQQDLYDQACSFLGSMTSETRQKYFAHIKKEYRDEI
jgi:hypothetical protein